VRVLVIEDVRRLADDIAEGLRDQGMAVDVAYDGLKAAAKLALNPYDGWSSTATCRAYTATPSADWPPRTRTGRWY
jgi:CheY-like chemotaxis protein